jgi:hypothetical protein
MLRRLERDETREIAGLRDPFALESPIVAPVLDVESETSLLPHDYPQWVKDATSVSTRARELIARLKPVVAKVLTFWDHRVRSVLVGNARVCVDASGSYRID